MKDIEQLKKFCSDERTNSNERKNASRILAKKWIYIDIATIERNADQILKIIRIHWMKGLILRFWFNPLHD